MKKKFWNYFNLQSSVVLLKFAFAKVPRGLLKFVVQKCLQNFVRQNNSCSISPLGTYLDQWACGRAQTHFSPRETHTRFFFPANPTNRAKQPREEPNSPEPNVKQEEADRQRRSQPWVRVRRKATNTRGGGGREGEREGGKALTRWPHVVSIMGARWVVELTHDRTPVDDVWAALGKTEGNGMAGPKGRDSGPEGGRNSLRSLMANLFILLHFLHSSRSGLHPLRLSPNIMKMYESRKYFSRQKQEVCCL